MNPLHVIRRLFLAIILTVLITLLSACGGSVSSDRTTTSSVAKSIDTYSDLPRFGDLPTDAVLRPGPLSTEEIAEVLSLRRKAGAFMVKCMNENGWNTTLEEDFPDYLSDFVYSPEAPLWPSDRLIMSNDPEHVLGLTGGITDDSTIEDAKKHLDLLNQMRPDLFQLSKSSTSFSSPIPSPKKN